MDPEMVAAALEASHKDIISNLSKYSTHLPIGWRFMDKFVQLPIVIPPSIGERVEEYVSDLLARKPDNKEISEDRLPQRPQRESPGRPLNSRRKPEIPSLASLYSRRKPKIPRRKPEIPFITSTARFFSDWRDYGLRIAIDRWRTRYSPHIIEEIDAMTFTNEQSVLLDEINKKIMDISNMDKDFLEKVKKNASQFSNNPREIKRYANLLRFQRFLIAALVKEENGIRFDQLSRWIVLSLRWPQVIRWLYWSSNQGDVKDKLKSLEKYAKESIVESKKWEEGLKKLLELTPDDKTTSWIKDNALREFFIKESKQETPLSSGAGKGLY